MDFNSTKDQSVKRLDMTGFELNQRKLINTLRIVEDLCGNKHPESRAISEKLYSELTTKILIKKQPEDIE